MAVRHLLKVYTCSVIRLLWAASFELGKPSSLLSSLFLNSYQSEEKWPQRPHHKSWQVDWVDSGSNIRPRCLWDKSLTLPTQTSAEQLDPIFCHRVSKLGPSLALHSWFQITNASLIDYLNQLCSARAKLKTCTYEGPQGRVFEILFWCVQFAWTFATSHNCLYVNDTFPQNVLEQTLRYVCSCVGGCDLKQ